MTTETTIGTVAMGDSTAMIGAYRKAKAEAQTWCGCYDSDENRHYIVSGNEIIWEQVFEDYDAGHSAMTAKLKDLRDMHALTAALSSRPAQEAGAVHPDQTSPMTVGIEEFLRGEDGVDLEPFAASSGVRSAVTDGFGPLAAWQELCDKDDRTSPEEYPDMCLITKDELADFMARSPIAAPQPVQAVAVKALEWVETRDGVYEIGARAETPIGSYSAWYFRLHTDPPKDCFGWQGPRSKDIETESYEAAKAAAQSDYDQRIRSALATPPHTQEAGTAAPQPATPSHGADTSATDPAPQGNAETLRQALTAAAKELDVISCVPNVTETTDAYDQLQRAKFFADRGAVAAWAVLRASPEPSKESGR